MKSKHIVYPTLFLCCFLLFSGPIFKKQDGRKEAGPRSLDEGSPALQSAKDAFDWERIRRDSSGAGKIGPTSGPPAPNKPEAGMSAREFGQFKANQ